MSHYFTNEPVKNSKDYEFSHTFLGVTLTFKSTSGVFSKSHFDTGSSVLLNFLPVLKDEIVLDMGSGIGSLGLSLAKKYPHTKVYLREINDKANGMAKTNIKLNGIRNAYLVSEEEVKRMSFDLVVFNPPIHLGKDNYYKMFRDLMLLLKPSGKIITVLKTVHGAKSFFKYWEPNIEKVGHKKGFYVFKLQRGEQIC